MPKIVRFDKLGGPEVLRIQEETSKQPGKGEVRLQVQAVGLNRAEALYVRGHYLEHPKLPSGIGYEAAGVVESVGPALNSGRAILLYGPPGNGKSSMALSFANVFTDVIYVPYAIVVEGQIIRIYDPSLHSLLSPDFMIEDNSLSFIRSDEYDARWVPCRRPFVVTGGELTLEMLDLRFDPISNFYEAPLHVKALGGCFLIDDFGRQLVSPKNLLNRWIIKIMNEKQNNISMLRFV